MTALVAPPRLQPGATVALLAPAIWPGPTRIDRRGSLGVPVLAGLPLGHLADPVAVPLGVECELDASAGTLRCAAATR